MDKLARIPQIDRLDPFADALNGPCLLHAERSRACAAEAGEHAAGGEALAQVAGDRADVGALGTPNTEGEDGPGVRGDLGLVDHDRARLEFRCAATAGEAVGPLAADADGGEGRGTLEDLASEMLIEDAANAIEGG